MPTVPTHIPTIGVGGPAAGLPVMGQWPEDGEQYTDEFPANMVYADGVWEDGVWGDGVWADGVWAD